MSVQRWDHKCGRNIVHSMTPSDDGAFVKYDALRAVCREARDKLKRIEVRAKHEYPVSIGNQGAWKFVLTEADAALATIEKALGE